MSLNNNYVIKCLICKYLNYDRKGPIMIDTLNSEIFRI